MSIDSRVFYVIKCKSQRHQISKLGVDSLAPIAECQELACRCVGFKDDTSPRTLGPFQHSQIPRDRKVLTDGRIRVKGS
jgi:hypothetical protein